MRYIISATAIALIAGIALGFAVTATVFEADAAKPPPSGRLIELGTLSTNPTVSNDVTFPLVSTGDCSSLSVMARTGNQEIHAIRFETLMVSPDGVNLMAAPNLSRGPTGPSLAAPLEAWPYVQIKVGASTTNFIVDITAWIWCAP